MTSDVGITLCVVTFGPQLMKQCRQAMLHTVPVICTQSVSR